MKGFIKNSFKKIADKPMKVRVSIIITAVVLLVALFFCGCKLFGSPLAKIRVISAANDYIDENMPGMECRRSICKYDLERDIYYIDYTPEGWKRSFRLEFREDGKLTKDGYTKEFMYDSMFELR